MNSTIQTLAEICGTHRFQEKCLFVPSYSVGHQIGEHLARAGTPWINLRVTTTEGYAEELIALELSAGGIRLIDSHERLLIIEKLYRDADFSEAAGRYFEEAARIPGILRSLGNAIHEVRMAGLEKSDIDPSVFVTPSKGDELA